MLEMFLKESENDSIVEDLYIARDVSNAKYSIEEKKKYLEEAIRNGGYYGDNGCWNSIMTFPNDKNVYRGRVETLIIKDDKFIFLKFLPRDSQNYKRTYTVPGGSFELNIPNDIQAINECIEEARIKISNIQASGITYKELKDPPKWAIEKQPVNWNGNYTEVYVGEYDGKYTGHIDKVDEDKFMITGKFYKLDEIFKYLKKEHKEALKVIYPNRFNSGKFVKESVNERNNVSVKQIKGVIKKIRAKVDKDNKIAIKMYTNRGFEKTGEFYDGEYWRMELKESNYTESSSENLFHISSVKLANTTLEPRIPDNFLVRNGYEDNTTERISVCKSIDDCLTAMSRNLNNKDFYVYKLKNTNIKKKTPSVKEVPDSSITNELWLLEPTEFELVGKIHVTGTKGDGLPYTYGDTTAELYRWKWSYVK